VQLLLHFVQLLSRRAEARALRVAWAGTEWCFL